MILIMRIFVVDVGNSFIKMEVFDGEESIGVWQIETLRDISEEAATKEIEGNLLQLKVTKNSFKGIVFCSVVPEVTSTIQKALINVFKNKPFINVTSQTKTGLIISEENKRIGADRIADMVGVTKIYGAPAVVVNMGTATVFTVIDDKMKILGGQIIAGGDLALQALLNRSTNISRIIGASDRNTPRIRIIPTDITIGKNTEENILSGAFWGLASQIEGISTTIKKELINRGIDSKEIKIVASGDLSNIFKNFKFSNVDYIDPELTRKGLRIIGEMNLS